MIGSICYAYHMLYFAENVTLVQAANSAALVERQLTPTESPGVLCLVLISRLLCVPAADVR